MTRDDPPLETKETARLPSDFIELDRGPEEVSSLYQDLRRTLLEESGHGRSHGIGRAQRLMRDLGVTSQIDHDEQSPNQTVPFDPFPRILSAREWEELTRGLVQRTAIWNAFFKDIYCGQEVLKSGLLPIEWVYDDPRYQRAAVGVRLPGECYMPIAAYDLAKNDRGDWVVRADHVSRSTGAGYALLARHVLSQVAPAVMEKVSLQPVHGYPTELLEHLRHSLPDRSLEPRMVLLSSGVYDQAYFEHSYLARQMGIPLVRGSDLIVLNSRVYLKTIGGLEPIDIIYRGMEDGDVDPVTLNEQSKVGVPGLMTCVRKGTVTVANAVGTGLGENRMIAASFSRLARFYLNEPLRLASVERRWCRDPDECEEVLSQLRSYFLTRRRPKSPPALWETDRMGNRQLEHLREQIRREPDDYLAERYLPQNRLPICTGEGPETRHVELRVFVFGGESPRVYPCALTRFAIDPASRRLTSELGGGIKDTWILGHQEEAAEETRRAVPSSQRRLRLGSRIADNLFWMGRYAERAENTARIFGVLQGLQAEDQQYQDPEGWVALWEALARATGHPTHFFKRPAWRRHPNLARYILLQQKNPSSVFTCLERCRQNAQATREAVPPEVWVILNRMHAYLRAAAIEADGKDQTETDTIRELQDHVLNQLNALSGCTAKTMLHNDNWHFWCMGTYVERSLTTVLVMRQVLLKRQGEKEPRQQAESNLNALLRMLSSQYAYRSLFQTRPTLQNAAQLLLQDPQLPRSVRFCLEGIRQALETAFGNAYRDHRPGFGLTPVKLCARLISEIEFADLTPFFDPPKTGRPPRLRRWLEHLADELAQLATAISDHYLHHQAFNILQ